MISWPYFLVGQLDQCRVVRNRLVERDAAEDPPCDRIPDVFDHHLIAELMLLLQVHDSKVCLHRHDRFACLSAESLDERRQEFLVVQKGADLGELIVQSAKLRRQHSLINLSLG